MNKETYLAELAAELSLLPDEERADVIADYEEHFTFARSKERSDNDIIEGLGPPRKIAKEILAQTKISAAGDNPSLGSISRAVYAAIGLGFFNLVVVLGPFIALLSVLFSLFAVSAALLLSPILILIDTGFSMAYVREFFIICGYVGVGLLLLAAAYHLSKLFYKLMARYLHLNLRIVRRR